jgi:hypothetical protein
VDVDTQVAQERAAIAGAIVMVLVTFAVRLAGGPFLLALALGALSSGLVRFAWLRRRGR